MKTVTRTIRTTVVVKDGTKTETVETTTTTGDISDDKFSELDAIFSSIDCAMNQLSSAVDNWSKTMENVFKKKTP